MHIIIGFLTSLVTILYLLDIGVAKLDGDLTAEQKRVAQSKFVDAIRSQLIRDEQRQGTWS